MSAAKLILKFCFLKIIIKTKIMLKNYVGWLAVVVLLGLLITPFATQAATFRGGDSVSINEVTEDDLYASGGTVSLYEPVQGDLYVAGGTVMLEEGANVAQDLKIVGGQISVRSDIVDDVHIAGGDIRLKKEVGDDLFVFGGNVTLDGKVKGDVYISSGTLAVNGVVDGDVHFAGGQFMLGEGAAIGGNLDYRAEAEADLAKGEIKGDVNFTPYEKKHTGSNPSFAPIAWAGVALPLVFLLCVAGLFLLGLFVVFAAPLKSRDVSTTLASHPWKSLGFGLFYLVVIPVAAIILMSLLITFPIAIFFLLVYLAGMIIAPALLSYFIGAKILSIFNKSADLNKKGHVVLAILIGVLIYSLVLMIPFVGGFVIFVGILLTLGSLFQVVSKMVFKKRNWNQKITE